MLTTTIVKRAYDVDRKHEPATEKGKEEPVAYGSLAKEKFNAEIERYGRY